MHQAIETELEHQQRPAHHFVNFAITAHGFTHAYQSANFTVGGFLQRTALLDELLAQLAGKFNSNESFNPTRGFQVGVVFVSIRGPGSGRDKRRNPGRLCLDRENKKKRCIITIKNNDRLCCARTIVTTRVENLHGIPWRIRTSISWKISPSKRLPWNCMEDKETSFHGNFSIDSFHKGFGHFPWNSIETDAISLKPLHRLFHGSPGSFMEFTGIKWHT